MKQWREIAKNFTLVGQLGLSFIMPLLLCLGLCWLICDKTRVGEWIFIPGFFFGLGASFMTAYKFYIAQMNKQDREDRNRKKKVSFNRH